MTLLVMGSLDNTLFLSTVSNQVTQQMAGDHRRKKLALTVLPHPGGCMPKMKKGSQFEKLLTIVNSPVSRHPLELEKVSVGTAVRLRELFP